MRKLHLIIFCSLIAPLLILIPALTQQYGPHYEHHKQANAELDEITRRMHERAAVQGVKEVKPAAPPVSTKPSAAMLPQGLPDWFRELDADEEGQVALHQWRAGGKSLEEFRKFDLNNDGFITADEVLRILRTPVELTAEHGQAKYDGTIEEFDEQYGEKPHAKLFIVKLEKGKTYQIDLKSKAFDAYLYLEDPNGNLITQDDDSGGNLDSRIIFAPTDTGAYRLIATGLGKVKTGSPFTFTIRVISSYGGTVPAGLPTWFKEIDKNEDGQIALHEWRAAGKDVDEFHALDQNNDGFITPDEVFRHMKKPIDANHDKDLMKSDDEIDEPIEGRYRGKKAYKILTIKLERGTTYQIDNVSPAFYAFTYLEDPDGELLEENNSGGRGKAARIVFQAPKSGIYRLIATSQDGVKSGPFTLTVRILSRSSIILPRGLPSWFRELDADGDGQVALHEWRAGGKKLSDFCRFDLNDDGYITVDEIVRCMKRPIELAAEDDQTTFNDTLESRPHEMYRGKRSYKILSVRLEEGKVYEIDCQSKTFQAFLYLEDSAGNPLAEKSSPTIGGNSRIVFRAPRTGTYRLVATSLGGFRTGDYAFSVRMKD